MFTNEVAPTLVASETPMIPSDFIEKMRSAVTPDIDKIAELVAEKLESKLPEKQIENTDKTVPKGFGLFMF